MSNQIISKQIYLRTFFNRCQAIGLTLLTSKMTTSTPQIVCCVRPSIPDNRKVIPISREESRRQGRASANKALDT